MEDFHPFAFTKHPDALWFLTELDEEHFYQTSSRLAALREPSFYTMHADGLAVRNKLSAMKVYLPHQRRIGEFGDGVTAN
ncbi:hypothetical protein JTE90_002019 [Oedothorax gibbosus]|uniref:Uncharacterized protein n=1 Tax=Oedothorax gibbosus TaxID=931172 RepID=A0AAV6UPU6_9ARAC|nr:hypothetical protein JTE90_002019 [Oedothorax gibbosus]